MHLCRTLRPRRGSRQVRSRVGSGSLDDLDAGFDDDPAVFVVRRRGGDRGQDRQVHAEWLVRELTGARDFLRKILGGGGLRQRGDHAERSGLGDGGDQFGAADPLHATLHDGWRTPNVSVKAVDSTVVLLAVKVRQDCGGRRCAARCPGSAGDLGGRERSVGLVPAGDGLAHAEQRAHGLLDVVDVEHALFGAVADEVDHDEFEAFARRSVGAPVRRGDTCRSSESSPERFAR